MDAKSFIMGSSNPGFSFVNVGDAIMGTLLKDPEIRQMKVWRNGKPTDELAVWPSGDPKMQLVLSLQTDFRNYEGIKDPDRAVPDDGKRTVYVNGRHRELALRRAVQDAGVDWMARGGKYWERFLGDDMTSTAGIKPKLAEIRYQAPPPQPPQGFGPPEPSWQQPGWTPPPAQAVPAVPSHHGSDQTMPDWATAPQAAPQSAPPAAPMSAPPGMSTLAAIRASQNAGIAGFPTDEAPF